MKKKSKAFSEAVPAPADHEDEWKVNSAMDDLMRAEEHKQNPKLMAAVHKHAHKKKKAIESIAGLRKKRQEMSEEKLPEEGDME